GRAIRYSVRRLHGSAAALLDVAQRCIEVVHLDIERDAAGACALIAADATIDAGTGMSHCVARDSRCELPVEDVFVKALQLVSVLAEDFEVHNGVGHDFSFRAAQSKAQT